MTVAELIELLKEMPQDALAVVRGYESGYDDIKGAKTVLIKNQDEIHREYLEYVKRKEKNGEPLNAFEDISHRPGWYDGVYEEWYRDDKTGYFEAVFIEQDFTKNQKREDEELARWSERNKEKIAKFEAEIMNQ